MDNDPTWSAVTRFYANGLVMEGNWAGGNGGGLYIQDNTEAIIERISRDCWNLDRCNHLIGNQSGTGVGLGGAFYLNGGSLDLKHTFIEENRADFGTAISASGDATTVTIQSSVFDDNGDEGSAGFSDFQVIRASLGANVSIKHSTIADNNATTSVFDIDPALNSSLTLLSSVVHDPSSGQIFGPVTGTLNIDCVITHEAGSFTGANVLVADPGFINRAMGDYHLSKLSPAIDLCEEIPMNNRFDMDWEPKGWNDPTSLNPSKFDAGADESYLNDVIFEDSFDG